MAAKNTLKLRQGYSGRTEPGDPDRFFFAVPHRVAKHLHPDQEYECVLTEDGILYRPVIEETEERVPAWIRRTPAE